jgi:hypothetical protein
MRRTEIRREKVRAIPDSEAVWHRGMSHVEWKNRHVVRKRRYSAHLTRPEFGNLQRCSGTRILTSSGSHFPFQTTTKDALLLMLRPCFSRPLVREGAVKGC